MQTKLHFWFMFLSAILIRPSIMPRSVVAQSL